MLKDASTGNQTSNLLITKRLLYPRTTVAPVFQSQVVWSEWCGLPLEPPPPEFPRGRGHVERVYGRLFHSACLRAEEEELRGWAVGMKEDLLWEGNVTHSSFQRHSHAHSLTHRQEHFRKPGLTTTLTVHPMGMSLISVCVSLCVE